MLATPTQLAAVAIVSLGAVASAHADVKVDWARGLVIADAVGIASRQAPNPAVARSTSRRGAEQEAQKLLAAKLDDLPLAGGAVGVRLRSHLPVLLRG